MQEEDRELEKKNLWKKVAELSTQKVIMGVLCTLLVLPWLQYESVDYFKPFGVIQLVDLDKASINQTYTQNLYVPFFKAYLGESEPMLYIRINKTIHFEEPGLVATHRPNEALNIVKYLPSSHIKAVMFSMGPTIYLLASRLKP